MPSKKKTKPEETSAEQESQTVAEPIPPPPPPEAWDSPEIQSLQLNWPKAETVRELGVPLTRDELGQAARELAATIGMIDELEEQKKSAVDAIKQKIAEQEAVQHRLAMLVNRGADEKPVPCVWVFGVSGRNDTGRFIRDDNMKTLVRKDTGDVVEIRGITNDDRQMSLLPDEPEESPKEKGRRAHADGLCIADCPFEPDSDAAFAWIEGYKESAGNDAAGVLVDAADDPYMQGRAARAKGEPRETCPYDTEGDDDRNDWLDGWDDASVLTLDAAEPDPASDSPPESAPDGELTNTDGADPHDKYQDGVNARETNIPRQRCPHPMGSVEAQTWKQGWDEQDEIIRATGTP